MICLGQIGVVNIVKILIERWRWAYKFKPQTYI
jgi:hypothetical protein